jgi:hypothetical protein
VTVPHRIVLVKEFEGPAIRLGLLARFGGSFNLSVVASAARWRDGMMLGMLAEPSHYPE